VKAVWEPKGRAGTQKVAKTIRKNGGQAFCMGREICSLLDLLCIRELRSGEQREDPDHFLPARSVSVRLRRTIMETRN
jgi:hypothetical protein